MKTKRPSRLAIVDHLTGLYNRRYFDKRLKKFIAEAKRKKKHFSLLMIDIDKFKDVNDKYGHLVGDKVLNDLAKVLKKSVRKPDICFRYGGDEVAVLLPNTGRKAAENVVARLKYKVEKYRFSTEGSSKLRLKLSVGLAVFPEDGLKPRMLIKKADELLYKVKRQKKPKKKITEPFILETKLIPPVLKANIINRPRLLALLRENLGKKLILITADAGYGKTTLVSQLLHQGNVPCAFYNLDLNDRDLPVFLLYLAEAMGKIQNGLGKRTGTLLSHLESIATNIEVVMGTLINEIVKKRKEDLFIIFDDYHIISKDSLVHQALDYFVNHLPINVHIIISTRISPSLPSLARWRSKQDVFELTKEDLKFTDKEIKFLLEDIYKTTLRSEELKRLIKHTEGWVAGVQMILLHTGAEKIKNALNGYLESNVPLFEYFANEILKKESKETQEFLLKSSILEWMTPDACNAVLGVNNSKEILQSLVKHNLFTNQVSKQTNIYKYHHLFREFLMNSLSEGKEVNKLHITAAIWYQKQKQFEWTIEHYLEAKGYERAAEIIEYIAEGEIDRGHTALVGQWLNTLPPDIIESHPWLLYQKARLIRRLGRATEAETLYLQAEQAFRKTGDRLALSDLNCALGFLYSTQGDYDLALKRFNKSLKNCPKADVGLRIHSLNGMGVAYFGLGNIKKAKDYFMEALSLCKNTDAGDIPVVARNNLGIIVLQKGELNDALNYFNKALTLLGNNFLFRGGNIFYNMARVLLYLGRLAEAEQWLYKGEKLFQQWNEVYSKAPIKSGFSLLHQFKGDLTEARKYAEEALNIETKLGIDTFASQLALVNIHREMKDYAEAERHLDSISIQEKKTVRTTQFLIERAQLNLDTGNTRQAFEDIETVMALSQREGFKLFLFQSYLCATMGYLCTKERNKSLEYLRRATGLAREYDYSYLLMQALRKEGDLSEIAKVLTKDDKWLSRLLKKEPLEIESEIRVFVLGKVRILRGDKEIQAKIWQGLKAKKLFCLLALNPQKGFTKDELMHIFWPQSKPLNAGRSLRITTYHIRKALGSVIIYKDRLYQLNPQLNLWIDANQFQSLTGKAKKIESKRAKENVLLKAIAFYRGMLCEGWYDSWVEDMRGRFERQYMDALLMLGDVYSTDNRTEEIIKCYEKLVKLDNLCEEYYRRLMKSYAKAGRIKDLKKLYERLKEILKEELDVEPEEDTQSLFRLLTFKNPK